MEKYSNKDKITLLVVFIIVGAFFIRGCLPISESQYEKQMYQNISDLQRTSLKFVEVVELSSDYVRKDRYTREEFSKLFSDFSNIHREQERVKDVQKKILKMKAPKKYSRVHSDIKFATRNLVLAVDNIVLYKAKSNPEYLKKAEECLIEYLYHINNANERLKELNGSSFLGDN